MSLKLAVSLMGQRRYLPMWIGQVFGAFNDNLFRWSLVVLATYQGLTVFDLPPEQMTPIAATIFTLPIFLFSAVAGQVADRFDRTMIMRVLKFAEIFLMTAAAVGFIFERPFVLLCVLFLMGVQTAFFIPARTSAMPTLLQPSELVTANALMSGPINVAILAGAIGATLLITQVWGPYVVGAILVSMAVLGWLGMRQGVPAPAWDPTLKIRANIVVETGRILAFLWRARDVFRPAAGVAWFWMMSAAVLTVLPLFARNVLGADESVVAVFQVLFTLGAVTGALACGALNRGEDALIFTVVGAAGLVIFPADIALYTAGWTPAGELAGVGAFVNDPANRRILIDLFMAAVSGGLFLVPLQAMTQRRADPERRGRLLAASGVLNGAAATLGPFVLFVLARTGLPVHAAFVFVSAGSLAAGLFFAWRMIVRAREAAA
ncbi:MFS transporter [Marinicauda salina]|uniref:MFS transporter n=1 Tax=Marinicauda salina TaxID=2135793 RepID=A0A2U2BTJ1_9PROT|nr:MFS transporter [Marinicauda salina]PWE17326.1 MFS transporter [Marinicauda salina]